MTKRNLPKPPAGSRSAASKPPTAPSSTERDQLKWDDGDSHNTSQSGRAANVVTASAPMSSMKINGVLRPMKVAQKSLCDDVSLGISTVKSAAKPIQPILPCCQPCFPGFGMSRLTRSQQ